MHSATSFNPRHRRNPCPSCSIAASSPPKRHTRHSRTTGGCVSPTQLLDCQRTVPRTPASNCAKTVLAGLYGIQHRVPLRRKLQEQQAS